MAKNTNSDKSLRVRRGRVDSVCLYEVKENELEVLENGESTSFHLNFAIFLLSTAVTSILTLCTATFASPLLQNIFLFVAIVGILFGAYLLLRWRKGRKSIKLVILTIKSRLQPELVDEGEEELEIVKDTVKIIQDNEIIKPEG
ncbi:MAG: hypothetical protein FWC34_02570 [Bacteroidetes bacterium]|nr:hypothetical protein [Bacteroidota bacterium]